MTPSYHPEVDAKGYALVPGDYVSFPTYPRGMAKGWITISKRAKGPWKDEKGVTHILPYLAIIVEDGTVYDLASKVRKLPRQIPPPSGLVREAKTVTASGAVSRQLQLPFPLYHTTSYTNVFEILESKSVRPRNYDSFVSFSEVPFTGDISHNDVTIVFNRRGIQQHLVKVEYTREWYERHKKHAAYIAGEQWREMFEAPEDCYSEEEDDYGERDDECYEEAYDDAQFESFSWKKDEREWISKTHQPVRFRQEDVAFIIVHDRGDAKQLNDSLAEEGYSGVRVKVKTGSRYVDARLRRATAIQRVIDKYLVIATRKFYWHGTASKNLHGILVNGLQPGAKKVFTDKMSGFVSKGRSIATYGGVYLADHFHVAYSAANEASRRSGVDISGSYSVVIVGVTFDTRTQNVMIDEDFLMQLVEYRLGSNLSDAMTRRPFREVMVPYRNTSQISYLGELDYLKLNEVASAIDTSDLSCIVDETNQQSLIHDLLFRYPAIKNRYSRRKRETDGLIEDLAKAYLLHLIEIDINNIRERRIDQLKAHIDKAPGFHQKFKSTEEGWQQGLDRELAKYKEEIAILKKPPRRFVGTFNMLRSATDRLSLKLKEMSEPSPKRSYHNIRVTEPIGYRGRNRILTVAEIVFSPKIDDPYVVVVHYDKGGLSQLTSGIEDMSPNYIVKNRSGHVIKKGPEVTAIMAAINKRAT